MKRYGKIAAAAAALSLMTGCATGLKSIQEREYSAMQAQGVLVEEKNPTTGAVLGILPGVGSFYAREPGYGFVNLLFWPLSILWDPVSGYDGSKTINYDITKHKLKREMNAELSALDDKLAVGEIDSAAYILSKREIEQKYNFY